ncbi:MAG: Ig-like domain-containing protein [Clostridia bacterium]|nr:Ig-like domain-containing protein [Clostridia bacterium]
MRNFKRILTLLLALALTLSLALAITSCGGDPDCTSHVDANEDGKCDNCTADVELPTSKTEYTVTVKDENGAKVPGVQLTISNLSGKTEVLTTDANGVAKGELIDDKTVVRVTYVSVPDGYYLPTTKPMFDKDATSCTVTIKVDERITHTVKVVDEAGNAVAGLSMMICQQACQNPVTTGEDGIAIFKFIPIEYDVKVKIADSAATYEIVGELDEEGYVHFPEGTTEFEIVVKAK